MVQDLILHTRLCGNGFTTQHVELFIPPWPKWSGGNILYQLGTSSQRANRRGRPSNISAWFIGSGGNAKTSRRNINVHSHVCMYLYIWRCAKIFWRLYTYMYAYILCMCVHVYIHMCVHIYTYICMYIYMYVHMQVYFIRRYAKTSWRQKNVFVASAYARRLSQLPHQVLFVCACVRVCGGGGGGGEKGEGGGGGGGGGPPPFM